MDKLTVDNLNESRNEYCALLVSKLSPLIMQGLFTYFNEAVDRCNDAEEESKYLMTFQKLLSSIPKWNQETINNETNRIVIESNCKYLEELLTCVHIIEMKILTNIKVGRVNKKIDVNIPKLNDFIHKVYIYVARKIYTNVYLFDQTVSSLQKQKHKRECEIIIRECILSVIRDTMPILNILENYLNESIEEFDFDDEDIQIKEVVSDVSSNVSDLSSNVSDLSSNVSDLSSNVSDLSSNVSTDNEKTMTINMTGGNLEETKNEEITDLKIIIPDEKPDNEVKNKIGFNDTDNIVSYDTNEKSSDISKTPIDKVEVSKDIENLERISELRNLNNENEDSDDEYLEIMDDNLDIDLSDMVVDI
jgi:hypothetical protein